jgi:hypothetical protein
MVYVVTFTINIPQMLAYIPYMDPMGFGIRKYMGGNIRVAGSFSRDLPVCDRPRLPMNGVTRPAWQARDGAISGYPWSYFGTC